MTPDSRPRWVGRRPRHARRHLHRVAVVRSSLPDRDTREAVLSTVPAHPYSADRRLHNLARKLWAIDPAAPADHWDAAVAAWHALAAGRTARSLASTQAEFARQHAHARTRVRASLDAAMAGASSVGEVVRRMCRVLGRVWFLSCRTLGEWLGVSHETARRRLAALVRSGSLRLVVPGSVSPTDREAATYSAAPLFALGDRSEDSDPHPDAVPFLASTGFTHPGTTPDSTPAVGCGLPCVNSHGFQPGTSLPAARPPSGEPR